jgi:serine protease AprX
VGATDPDGQEVQDYSSRGPTSDGRRRPHVVAPGGSFADELSGLLAGGAVGTIGVGTSYAAPHVAGLLALLLEREPELSPDQQRALMIDACEKLAQGTEDEQGAGLVRAETLLA